MGLALEGIEGWVDHVLMLQEFLSSPSRRYNDSIGRIGGQLSLNSGLEDREVGNLLI